MLITIVPSSLGAQNTARSHKKMTNSANAIQDIVVKLQKIKPFTKERVGKVLNAKLIEKNRNEFFSFFEADGAVSANGLNLSKIDLRLRIDGKPHPGFLVFDISDPCVTFDEISKQFAGMKLTGAPTGRSLDEQRSYSIQDDWGKLSFGFAERKPDCLASVVLDPKREK
jgi:hypothetical protein